MTLQSQLTQLVDVCAGHCEIHQIFVLDLVDDLLEQLIGYIEQDRHVRNDLLLVDWYSVIRQTKSIVQLKTPLCDLTQVEYPTQAQRQYRIALQRCLSS